MRSVFIENGRVSVESVPSPTCPENGVLVQTAFSLISAGTEKAAFTAPSGNFGGEVRRAGRLAKKVMQKLSQEGVRVTVQSIQAKLSEGGSGFLPGYSAAGTVIQCGPDVNDISVGTPVACAGEYAHHQEILAVPRNLVARVPDGVDLRHAAFTTVGAIALQGVRQARIQIGETVAVIGLGLVGQLSVQLLKAAGCRVIGSDVSAERLSLAEKMGLIRGVLAGSNQLADSVRELTREIGVDATILCAATESSRPVREAMEITRRRGRVVVVGSVGMDLERQPFYEKEIEFTISCSCGPGRYDPLYEIGGVDYPVGFVRWTENRNMEEFIRLLAESRVEVGPLLQAEFPISEAPAAYEELTCGRHPVGVLLSYLQKSDVEVSSRKIKVNLPPRGKKVLNVAVIGAGEFAQYVHLPNLKKMQGIHLKAVVNQRAERAKAVANRFGAEYCTTDPAEVLKDPEIDAVLITMRHDLHAPLAVAAANAGKDIFLEKPMGLTHQECHEVAEAVQNSRVRFFVGFNRRFAPLSERARQVMTECRGPWHIIYRVNAPRLPRDHWTQDPSVGGGRIIGEGCHFIDLCSYLIGNEIIEIWGRALPVDGGVVTALDSYSAIIRYCDGSVASIIYTTVGSDELSKERIEMFRGGCAAVLEDFRLLNLYTLHGKSKSHSSQDKGHYSQLAAFFDWVSGGKAPDMSLEDILRTSEAALSVHAAVRRAG